MRRITAVLIIAFGLISQITLAEGLSRKEIRAIGEAYEEAWNNGDFEALKGLYLDPDKLDRQFIIKHMKAAKVRSRGEDDGHILILFEYESEIVHPKNKYCERSCSDNDTVKLWLLITNEGDIKYDCVHIIHPIEYALNVRFRLYVNYGKRDEKSVIHPKFLREANAHIEKLRALGIPLFNLSLDKSPSEISQSLDELYDWLKDNGEEWDSSEPNVYLPKTIFKTFYKKTERGFYY